MVKKADARDGRQKGELRASQSQTTTSDQTGPSSYRPLCPKRGLCGTQYRSMRHSPAHEPKS
jgi:hypothetical protein